jgi:8-oxo-dGTP pyrophosphatase MutT (NUDIX family)
MVLAGVESRYVRDRYNKDKKDLTEKDQLKLRELSALEEFRTVGFKSDADSLIAAKQKFGERAKRITDAEIRAIQSKSGSAADTSHIRFQFDTPKPVKDGYEVRFRELKFDGPANQQPKFGIIKGGREACDGTLEDAAIREVAEEVGMTLKRGDMVDMGIAEGYACFSFEIDPIHVAVWDDVITRRRERNYGELFHLGFLPLQEVLSDPRVARDVFKRLPTTLVLPQGYELGINRKTIVALRTFLKYITDGPKSKKGGRRRARSRKMIRSDSRGRRRNRRGSRRSSRRP